MADEISIEITGTAELIKQIDDMSKSVDPEKVEPVLMDAGKIVYDEIEPRVPIGPTGHLHKALIIKKLTRRGRDIPAPVLVGMDRKKAPHAWLVEFGSPGRYAKKGKHPGKYSGPMPANPFMRTGWDASKDRAYYFIRDGIRRILEAGAKQ
jgi:HK97 gp10 family phage protein